MSTGESAGTLGEERGSGVRLVTSQLTKVFGSRLVLAGVDLEARHCAREGIALRVIREDDPA